MAKTDLHLCLNFYNKAYLNIKYCLSSNDSAQRHPTTNQDFALLDDGLFRLMETSNVCVNKTVAAPCIQASNELETDVPFLLRPDDVSINYRRFMFVIRPENSTASSTVRAEQC